MNLLVAFAIFCIVGNIINNTSDTFYNILFYKQLFKTTQKLKIFINQ